VTAACARGHADACVIDLPPPRANTWTVPPDAPPALAPSHEARGAPLPGGPLATRDAASAPLALARLRAVDGPKAFFGGVGFVVGTPGVWPYAAVPVAVLLVLGAGAAAVGLWASWHLVSSIVSGASAWAEAGRWLLEILVGGVALLAAVLVAFALAQPLSGFALEALSERQERALGGTGAHPKPRFVDNLVRSIAVNLLGLAVGLPIMAALTLVELVAPPAAVVTWPLKLVVSALLLAWDMLDYPLGLRGVNVGARLRFFGRNLLPLLGFGIFGAPFLLGPGLGLLLLPFGVAGATRLVLQTERRR
jgi:CysZ protein